MQKNKIIVIAAIAGILIAVFFLWTAYTAKRESDQLVSRFNEIDKDLQESNKKIADENKNLVGSIQDKYELASKKSNLFMLIDSMREDLNNEVAPGSSLKNEFYRLISGVLDLNKYIRESKELSGVDTVSLNFSSETLNAEQLYKDNFVQVPKPVSITYLNYIRMQLIKASNQ